MSLTSKVSLWMSNILDMKRRKRIFETKRMNKNLGDGEFDLYGISNDESDDSPSKINYNRLNYEESKASMGIPGESIVSISQKDLILFNRKRSQ